MNIARITIYLIHTRGHEQVARMHGAKHRDYYFFKDPNSSRYRRVYEEGREPNPAGGVFPLDLATVNAHIADISSGGEIKEIGLRVEIESAEQVEEGRNRIEAERVRREDAQKLLAESLAEQERKLQEANDSKSRLERGVNEPASGPKESPEKPAEPKPKKGIRAATVRPIGE